VQLVRTEGELVAALGVGAVRELMVELGASEASPNADAETLA
jgi:hypothetical protein